MKRVVLDASALMIFLEDQRGAEKVEELITLAVAGKRQLLMSVVNWGEVYYSAWRMRGRQAALKVKADIAQLPVEVVNADFEVTQLAAELRAQHKLPYADAFGAALAKLRNATVVTSDADFSVVKGQIPLLFI